jgi:hypothetical protein
LVLVGKFRIAALAVVSAVLLGLVGWTAAGAIGDEREPGKELCDALTTDLGYAVTGSKQLPDLAKVDALRYGSCDIKKTIRSDLHFPGVDDHHEATIAGRVSLSPEKDTSFLKQVKRNIERSGGTTVPVPRLGRHAFITVVPHTARLGAMNGDEVAGTSPTGESVESPAPSPFPAQAYWQQGHNFFSVQAATEGASAAQAERFTARLAELINRRPVHGS